MKKFIISSVSIILLLILTFVCIVGYSHSLGQQYDKTYLAAMADKYDRLNTIDEPKLILVGGSNIPFGVDSSLVEKEIGIPVVNFGLYAALGSKTTLDLAKSNINKNDIVIFIPEFSAQIYSKYINGEIMLQTLDSRKMMAFNIPFVDWITMINYYPSYIMQKKEFLANGNKPNPQNAYSRNAFNQYGDIIYPRPYNIMPDMYNSADIIEIDTKIIGSDFIEYFNDYITWARRRGAEIYLSFPPVNKKSLSSNSDLEKRLEFYDYTRDVFDCKVISNIEDYIMDEGYFYDTNYHLNDTGVIYRTAKLIGDIKRTLRLTTPTEIEIPLPSGMEPVTPPDNPDEENNENVKNFIYSEIDGRMVIEGVSESAKNKNILEIPSTIEGKTVYKISGSAFSGCNNLVRLDIPQTVMMLEDKSFAGCESLEIVNMFLNKSVSALFPTVGDGLFDGANAALKIYVPKSKYALMKTDYTWSKYSERLAMMSE